MSSIRRGLVCLAVFALAGAASGPAAPGSKTKLKGSNFYSNCRFSHTAPDDPIVYPGQPGASHLHQFYGNTSADAYSTYSSLRENGSSTCMSPLNRSAYWMPALLNGAGYVVRPDYVAIYYKRRPASDPKCGGLGTVVGAEGTCVPLPNGLRFIFGFNMLSPSDTPTRRRDRACSPRH